MFKKCKFWWRARWNLSWLLFFAFWLLSGSVSGFPRAPGLADLVLGRGEGRPLLVIKKLVKLVLHIFQAPLGSGRLGSCFPFPVVWQGKGLSLGYNNHRCPVSSPHPQSTHCVAAFSTLQSWAGLAPINLLSLHLFDHSLSGSKSCPQSSPLLAGQLLTRDPCPVLLSSHFEVCLGAVAAPNHCLAFHTNSLTSPESISVMARSSSPLLPAPGANRTYTPTTLWHCTSLATSPTP